MTITLGQLGLYAGALFILWATPGPVWMAVLARGLAGGFKSVLPVALAVVIGDMLWSLLAIFGITAITSIYENFLTVVQLIGATMFVIMGVLLIRHADASITENKALTRPGIWAGFLAGLMTIVANPKAIIFYMGLLPTFFEFQVLETGDIVVICLISAAVPFVGNLAIGSALGFVRGLLNSPKSLRRINIFAGCAMILVGLVIAFT